MLLKQTPQPALFTSLRNYWGRTGDPTAVRALFLLENSMSGCCMQASRFFFLNVFSCMLVCPLIMSMSAGRCGGWNLPFFVGERNVSTFVLQIAVSFINSLRWLWACTHFQCLSSGVITQFECLPFLWSVYLFPFPTSVEHILTGCPAMLSIEEQLWVKNSWVF